VLAISQQLQVRSDTRDALRKPVVDSGGNHDADISGPGSGCCSRTDGVGEPRRSGCLRRRHCDGRYAIWTQAKAIAGRLVRRLSAVDPGGACYHAGAITRFWRHASLIQPSCLSIGTAPADQSGRWVIPPSRGASAGLPIDPRCRQSRGGQPLSLTGRGGSRRMRCVGARGCERGFVLDASLVLRTFNQTGAWWLRLVAVGELVVTGLTWVGVDLVPEFGESEAHAAFHGAGG